MNSRRIVMAICILVVSLCTVAFAIWYSGVYEEWACEKNGGKWFQVRNTCIEE